MAYKKRRRKKRYSVDWKRLAIALGALAVVILLIVGLWALLSPSPDQAAQSPAGVSQTEDPTPQPLDGSTATPDPALITPIPVPTATQSASGESKMLPIVDRHKNPGGQYLALTVDDCFQTENVREILDLADEYGFKITFFPIGQVAKKSPELWREIYARGHQIENHSYSHTNITKLTRDEARLEITRQNDVINEILGVRYEMHFFRPMGGTGRKEPWLHEMLSDLGYRAIASWGLSGSRNSKDTLSLLSPGQVILFHSTDKDLIRLKNVIPGAIEQGYTFVTLNELYGQEPNATYPLEGAAPLDEDDGEFEYVPDDYEEDAQENGS